MPYRRRENIPRSAQLAIFSPSVQGESRSVPGRTATGTKKPSFAALRATFATRSFLWHSFSAKQSSILFWGNIMLDRRLPVWLARRGLLCVFSSPDRKTAPIGDQGRVGTSFLVTQNGSLWNSHELTASALAVATEPKEPQLPSGPRSMRDECLQAIRAYAERIVTAITDKLRPRSKSGLES